MADFAALAAARRERPVTVLDVRRDLESAAGHVDGAVHIPLHELRGRLGEIPGGELWVHCQAGYRAAVAASLLQAAQREVTAIDDEFGHAAAAGLPVVGEPEAAEPVVQGPVSSPPLPAAPPGRPGRSSVSPDRPGERPLSPWAAGSNLDRALTTWCTVGHLGLSRLIVGVSVPGT